MFNDVITAQPTFTARVLRCLIDGAMTGAQMGFARSLVKSAAPYVKRGNVRKGIRGCQVDLLVQTAQSQCYVEIKHGREIGDEVVSEMRAKLKAIRPPDGISIRTALVYDGQLAATVPAGGYFNAVIDVRELIF